MALNGSTTHVDSEYENYQRLYDLLMTGSVDSFGATVPEAEIVPLLPPIPSPDATQGKQNEQANTRKRKLSPTSEKTIEVKDVQIASLTKEKQELEERLIFREHQLNNASQQIEALKKDALDHLQNCTFLNIKIEGLLGVIEELKHQNQGLQAKGLSLDKSLRDLHHANQYLALLARQKSRAELSDSSYTNTSATVTKEHSSQNSVENTALTIPEWFAMPEILDLPLSPTHSPVLHYAELQKRSFPQQQITCGLPQVEAISEIERNKRSDQSSGCKFP